MGLIREPKNVDFYVLDKAWTEAEKKEFSEFIKNQKERKQKIETKTSLTLRKRVLA